MTKNKIYLVICKEEADGIESFDDIYLLRNEDVFLFTDKDTASESLSEGDMLLELTVDRIGKALPIALKEISLE